MNKVCVALFWSWWFSLLLLSPAGHGGEGRVGGSVMIGRSGSGRSNLLQFGDTYMGALSAAMIFGHPCGLSSALSTRLFNLLWRLFINGSMLELLFFPIPSGLLPGDGDEDRQRVPFLWFGGGRRQGPDCFFTFSPRVFFAKLEDWVVIFLLLVYLSVKPAV
jgi:hypothetical protein